MIKSYVNDQEVQIYSLNYDEWVYKKHNEKENISFLRLIIGYSEFAEEIKPKYDDFIKEMIEDDIKSNETNFFQDTYGIPHYPCFDDIIYEAENNNFKIEFLNDFFIKEILTQYTGSDPLNERHKWVIRNITSVNNDKINVYISGEVQRISYYTAGAAAI